MSTLPFQYSIVRYVENVVRDEPVNIGVIVRNQAMKEATAIFLTPAAVLRKGGPKAKLLAISLQQRLRASDFEPIGSAAIVHTPRFFDDARRELHGNLRFSEPNGVLAKNIEQAAKRVFESYVAEPHRAAATEASTTLLSPSKMRSYLWSAFSRLHLLAPDKVQKDYTVQGRHATWKFDVGYRNGTLSLINALAIGTDIAQKNLDRALLYMGMISEVREAGIGEIHPIAVISPPSIHAKESAYAEAQSILKDANIVTYNLKDVESLARRAQQELT